MQYLELQASSSRTSYYRLLGDHQGRVERYVVSTAPSRRICNQPELLGMEFTGALQEAMTAALAEAPFSRFLAATPQERVCVVHFLRGGLNFEIRRALSEAYGFNSHPSAFMSSQRRRIDGRWQVREDMYRKLNIPDKSVLVMGDVVATGVTIANGMEVIAERVKRSGGSLRGLVMFTIGCHKAEKVLEDFDKRLRSRYSDYERTILVYLEGKFRLVDSTTDIRLAIPGTDLIRRGALLAPELVRSHYEKESYPLERCAIYDSGSRSFEVPRYLADTAGYWEAQAEWARGGGTLAEALQERWPEDDYRTMDNFLEIHRRRWRGVPDPLLIDIHDGFKRRKEQSKRLATAEALRRLCADRLAALRAAGGQETRANAVPGAARS